MKTICELIANLECAPKRKGIRYVRDEDLTNAIIALKELEDACRTLVNVAEFLGLLKGDNDD